MKTVYPILLFVLLNIAETKAQNNYWSKSQREAIASDIMNELMKYKSLSATQKEVIANCGTEEITEKYLPNEYQTQLDIKIKFIRNSAITNCSKNNGIELKSEEEKPAEKSTPDWNKDSKTEVYKDAIATLMKYDISEDQRETTAMCYLDEITKAYHKIELDNLIDAELKKVKSDIIKRCMDKNNVSTSKPAPEKLTIKGIAGCWQSYDFSICFNESGEMEKRMDKGFIKTSKGKWFIEDDTILFVLKESKEEYKVIYNSGESLKLEEIISKKVLHFTKISKF